MADTALRAFQVGIESTYGTGVAATREWYGEGAIQGVNQSPIMLNEERGRHDAYDRASQHTLQYEWSFTGGLDLDDMVEMLLLGIDGTVTSTGAGPYVWTFTPNATLDSATIEWDTSGWVVEATGCMLDRMRLSGNVSGGDVTVELSGPAQDRAASSLTGLSRHVTNVVQGWEAQFYLDALGATPGTTEVAGTLVNWELELQNNLARQWRADNTRSINSVGRGRRLITGSILADIDTAAVTTAIASQEAVTEQLIRLNLANNISAGGGNYQLTMDIPCALTTNVIEAEAEMTMVRFDFTSIFDPTNAYAFEFTLTNSRNT